MAFDLFCFATAEKFNNFLCPAFLEVVKEEQPSHDSKVENERKSFTDLYLEAEKLGVGAFSVVKRGISIKNGKEYAIKVITKSKLDKKDELALKEEINILRSLKHKNIIQLFDVHVEEKHYFLVMELMEGGELLDRIVKKESYNEKEARDVVKICFQAISYCHFKNIAHRDLKPENLLLIDKFDDTTIKIADFGFAKIAASDCSLKTQCGTPGYVAPEILRGEAYGTKVDMWSLGCILFILLGGYPPFAEKKPKDLFRKIRKADYKFHSKYWASISIDAKKLIKGLLTLNPKKRLSSLDALNHKWMTAGDKVLLAKDLSMNLTRLKEFNAERKFKAAVNAVLVVKKLESLGNDLDLDYDVNEI